MQGPSWPRGFSGAELEEVSEKELVDLVKQRMSVVYLGFFSYFVFLLLSFFYNFARKRFCST
jgi:hypothetical protein